MRTKIKILQQLSICLILIGAIHIQASANTQEDPCLTSTGAFQSQSFDEQTAAFEATFIATPLVDSIDAVVGLSSIEAAAHSDMACIVRFRTDGAIYARNGSAYEAVSTITYTANTSYSFRLAVDFLTHTYSVYVTPEGGSELTVGNNFNFRTEQSEAGSISYLDLADVDGDDGRLQICSIAVAPSSSTCITSMGSFLSQSFDNQTGAFEATFIATPLVDSIDAVVGLSSIEATAHSDMACIVRFRTDGAIYARNGSAYEAASTITYTANTSYSFRLAVDFLTHTYSVYVTPEGGSELTVGYNFNFRTEQSEAGSISYLDLADVDGDDGRLQICSIAVAPSSSTCLTSMGSFQSQSFDNQTGAFEATFIATPLADSIDVVVGLSSIEAAAHSDMACIVRFKGDGAIYARNGSAYEAASPIPYTANTIYSFRLVVDFLTQTYSVYVTPQGGGELTVGKNFNFRTEQSEASSLSYLNTVDVDGDDGRLRICDLDTGIPASSCLTSAGSFQSQSFESQSAAFEATFGATPLADSIDVVVGLSSIEATAHSDMACIARFRSDGTIYARNGSSYEASASIPYTVNTIYSFRLQVDLSAHTYSIFVTPQGGSELLLGVNYNFRTEQSEASSLSFLNVVDVDGDDGRLRVCDLEIGEYMVPSTVNLALYKPTYTTAKVYEGYESSKLVDGDDSYDNSVWSSDAVFPQSVVIDLGGEYVIDSTQLVSYRGNTPQYTISVAGNDSSFVQVIDRSENNLPGLIEAPLVDQFDGAVARYLKIEVLGYAQDPGTYFALAELRAFGYEYVDLSRENIALNKPTVATGNVYETYESSKLVDGDDSDDSVWSTDSDFPHSIVIDLLGEYTIDSTQLVVFKGRTPEYTISLAGNDSVFVQVIDRSDNTTPGLIEAPITDIFNAEVARYLKIEVTGFVEETGNYFALAEFRVYGESTSTSVESKRLSEADISMYPNPVSTMLTITGEQGEVEIEIYSISGSKIYQTSQAVTFPHQIDVSSYKSGIYLVRVKKDGSYFSKKVIK